MLPADYVPARNAWAARFRPMHQQIGIAYFGLQGAARDADAAQELLRQLRALWIAAPEHGPDSHEVARSVACEEGRGAGSVEGAGNPGSPARLEETVCITYWREPARLRQWIASPAFAEWRRTVLSHGTRLGLYIEMLCAKASDFETLFSTERFEGLAAIADDSPVHDIHEHGYWGSMRDRLPAAQTSALEPGETLTVARDESVELGASGPRRRIVLAPHEYIAVIRSGQDWTDTTGEERDCYLRQIEPALRAAMDTLSGSGVSHGCYSNRYLQLVDDDGRRLQKTFGLSHWRSLAHLETWASQDAEHLEIFQRFLGMARKLGKIDLRLYHEVMVLAAEDQYYEYVGCEPGCGVMRGLRA